MTVHTKIVRSNDFQKLRKTVMDWIEKNSHINLDSIEIDTFFIGEETLFEMTITYEEEEK